MLKYLRDRFLAQSDEPIDPERLDRELHERLVAEKIGYGWLARRVLAWGTVFFVIGFAVGSKSIMAIGATAAMVALITGAATTVHVIICALCGAAVWLLPPFGDTIALAVALLACLLVSLIDEGFVD